MAHQGKNQQNSNDGKFPRANGLISSTNRLKGKKERNEKRILKIKRFLRNTVYQPVTLRGSNMNPDSKSWENKKQSLMSGNWSGAHSKAILSCGGNNPTGHQHPTR